MIRSLPNVSYSRPQLAAQFDPYGSRGAISRISTTSVSPGEAPVTAIGPGHDVHAGRPVGLRDGLPDRPHAVVHHQVGGVAGVVGDRFDRQLGAVVDGEHGLEGGIEEAPEAVLGRGGQAIHGLTVRPTCVGSVSALWPPRDSDGPDVRSLETARLTPAGRSSPARRRRGGGCRRRRRSSGSPRPMARAISAWWRAERLTILVTSARLASADSSEAKSSERNSWPITLP